jgi:O-antigen/teichoic acid export membrane protein
MTRFLQSGGFTHNVIQLATGTAIAQIAPLLVTPLLARLYSPTQFGEFGIFSTFLLGLSIIASGRYEIAVPLPESNRTSFDLVVLSVLISVTFSLLIAAIVGLSRSLGGGVATILGLRENAMLLLPVGVLLASVMQSCSYWLTRNGRFTVVARARSTHGLLTAGSAVMMGALGLSAGLLVSVLVGYLAGAAVLAAAVVTTDGKRIREIKVVRLWQALKDFREFPFFNGSNALMDAVRESGTLVVFSVLFGTASTGFLTQTLRILRAPVSLLGQAVAQVYFPAVGKAQAEGRSVRELTARTIKSILAVAVPLYLVILVSGPWLFSLVLGEEWVTSGVYARILSPWLALVLVLSSLSLLPVARKVQHKALGLNAIETTARFVGLFVGGRLGGPVGAVMGMAVGGLATGGVQLAWYWRLSGRTDSALISQGSAG